MQHSRPLEIVFLTNFTDYSYRSIPAVAQMADDFAVRLTIVHACAEKRDGCTEADAYAQLQSFFPEADLYADCRRELLYGDPVDAVKRLQMVQDVDLVVAPAADPLGLPRIGHRSMRARLLRQCGTPLWTICRRTDVAKVRTRPRRVACWIDFDDSLNHFAYALEYAWRLDVKLHILHALPEVHEGMLTLAGDRPLHENGVIRELRKRIGWSPVPLEYHIVERGDSPRAAARLVEQSCADVVFVAEKPPLLGGWLPTKPALLDNCSCPVVCVPHKLQAPVWRLEQERKLSERAGESAINPAGAGPWSRG